MLIYVRDINDYFRIVRVLISVQHILNDKRVY